MGTWRNGLFIWDSENTEEKALEMEHLSLYGGSVRQNWKEGLYNEDSKRCVIQGSRNGAFVFIWVSQWEPIGT